MSENSYHSMETVNFRRFLSYIYAYEDDTKLRNVGFAKVEMRAQRVRFQVTVNGIFQKGGRPLEVCLVNEKMERIPVGQMILQNGRGDYRGTSNTDDMWGSKIPFSGVCGICLQGAGNKHHYYMTLWREVNRAGVSQKQITVIPGGKKAERETETDAKMKSAEAETEMAETEYKEEKPVVEFEEEAKETTVKAEHEAEVAAMEPEHEGEVTAMEPERETKEAAVKEEHEAEVTATEAEHEEKEIIKEPEYKAKVTESELEHETEATAMEPEHKAEVATAESEWEGSVCTAECNTEKREETSAIHKEAVKNEDEWEENRGEEIALQEEMESASQLQRPLGRKNCRNVRGRGEDKRMELWKRFCSRYPHVDIRPERFDESGMNGGFSKACRMCEALRIRPNDIGRLPRNNWILAHNSFLQHAYNYSHQLILFRIENQEMGNVVNRWFIGLPGENNEQETLVAEVFGFKKYLKCKNGGFWYTEIYMGVY